MLKKIVLIISFLLVLLITIFILFVLGEYLNQQIVTNIQENFEQQATEFATTPEIMIEEVPECNDELRIFLFDYDSDIWDEYTTVIKDASCDVDYFWSQIVELPVEYEPPEYIVQEYIDSPFVTPDSFSQRIENNACLRPTSDTAAAYYCRVSNGIRISEPTKFLSYLEWKENQFGELAIMMTVAHEWGHHVQSLLSIEHNSNTELQAECFKGLYFHFAVNNPDLARVDVSQADWNALISVFPLDVTDIMVSDSGPWENISIAEQGQALQIGYDRDLSTCLEQYGSNPLDESTSP